MTQTSPRDIILHRRSPVINKRPLVSDIGLGELAINYHDDDVAIYLRDRQNDIRKVGGIWYSSSAPDPSSVANGWQNLSHGELWVQRGNFPGSSNEEDASLYIYNKYINNNAGGWIEVFSGKFAAVDDYLDQFKDATDGSDYIHTARNQLKINNKSALRGYATTIPSDDETDVTKANTLVINDQHNFATGVTLNANNLVIDSSDIDVTSDAIALNAETAYTFQTTSVTGSSNSVFTIVGHGFFNGEEVYVTQYLNDGVTASGLTPGNYFVTEATLNTFKLRSGNTAVLATGNIKINYTPKLLLDRDFNVIQSGNFKLKENAEIPDNSQIKEGTWDIYHDTSNGNVRVYARVDNKIVQPDSSTVSFPVKNSSTSTITAGAPVYLTGQDPVRKVITVAAADAAVPAQMSAIGVAQTSIAAGGVGNVTAFGIIKLDTSSLDGATNLDDSGKVVFVKSGGGLTLTAPDFTVDQVQPLGILFKESATDGEIFINHPDTLNDLPPLGNNYIWVGTTQNEAVAHQLNSDSFQTRSIGGIEEILLADEVKFGAYEFLWDNGDPRSRVQSKVTSTEITNQTAGVQIQVDAFPTTYRSAKLFVQISSSGTGVTPQHQITELLVIHDGTNVDIVDYGTAITSGERMGEFSAEINSGTNEVKVLFLRNIGINGQLVVKAVRTSVLS